MSNTWGGARPGAGRPPREELSLEWRRRDRVMGALCAYGPALYLQSPDDPFAFSAAQLEADWREWACNAGFWGSGHDFPEETYAHQHFVRGLSVGEAIAAVEDELVRLGVRRRPAPSVLALAARAEEEE